MTEPLGPDAHLGLDRIADLDEGLLSDTEAQAARDHLAGCDECQADLAALTAVHDALLADAEIPMPQDIADRIFGALEELPPLAPAAAAVTTLPVRSGPSRWERSRKPLLASLAAAAGIALLAVGIIHLPKSEGSKAASAAGTTAAATTAPAPQVLHSGHNYDAKTLGADGVALLVPRNSGAAAAAPTSAAAAAAATTGAAPAPATTTAAAPTAGGVASAAARPMATTGAPAAGTSSSAAGTAAAPTTSAAAPAAPPVTTDALSQLRDPGAAQRCVALLLGSTTPPRVLDYATFDGKPAVIAVVDDPQDATKLAVIAVGPPGCGLYSLNFVSKP